MANDYYPSETRVTPVEDILDTQQAEMVSRKIRHQMRKEVMMPPYPEPLPPPEEMRMMMPPPEEMRLRQLPPPPEPDRVLMINCRDIAEHIKKCEICSKVFNTDKTLYIVAIVTLVVICLYLLKKILAI